MTFNGARLWMRRETAALPMLGSLLELERIRLMALPSRNVPI